MLIVAGARCVGYSVADGSGVRVLLEAGAAVYLRAPERAVCRDGE